MRWMGSEVQLERRKPKVNSTSTVVGFCRIDDSSAINDKYIYMFVRPFDSPILLHFISLFLNRYKEKKDIDYTPSLKDFSRSASCNLMSLRKSGPNSATFF